MVRDKAVSVSLNVSAAQDRIDVLGEYDREEDFSPLIENIRQAMLKTARLEISFYDALTLPKEVIEAMAAVILAGKDLKIFTYHSYLTHILVSLSLPVNHVPHKAISKQKEELKAVVIGGSADSLDKILYFIKHLPVSRLPIFIVQHLDEKTENKLDSLLKTYTDYQILMPTHLCKVEQGTIYIAPPGYHLKVANGLIYLTHDAKVCFARPSIDVLFKSLSLEYGKGLVGLLLCGLNIDGVAGCQALRTHGGTVLLEDSAECSAPFLPDQARKQGIYDYIMGIREMTSYVPSTTAKPGEELSSELIDLFLEALNHCYGYDYRGYQYTTVKRRIDKLMRLLEIDDFHSFQHQILLDPGLFRRFYQEMSVEVTSFFRHPDQFKRMREEILPYLDSFPRLKIWSAGCASGEEVYTLALLLDEMEMLEKSQIFATDINHFAISHAKSGLFPLQSLEQNRSNYLASGGKKNFDSHVENNGLYLKIPDHYHKHILFYQHSLIHDGVFNEFQLILCRNVLIYFKPILQEQVMDNFSRSLHPDGFLVLGKSEGLSTGQGGRYFEPFDRQGKIYRFK